MTTSAARVSSPPPGADVELPEGQGPASAPLDAAVEYVRAHLDRVLPLYVLAMVPYTAVMIPLIDDAVAGRRTRIASGCAYLVACTVWRWVWLARLQRRVQQDLHPFPEGGFWSRLVPILHVRLVSNFAITWGSVLAGIPAFYGLYVGSFATPLLLESDEAALPRVGKSLSWIQHSGRRLIRVGMIFTALAFILTIAVFVGQAALAGTVLPSLLGMNTADLDVTLNSWPWRLRVFYFVFLVLDAFWAVAAVFLYYDTQSRRMATDLRARLGRIEAAEGQA